MVAGPYPEVEPYDQGMPEVGDGQLVYWEMCGNPEGKPAVVLNTTHHLLGDIEQLRRHLGVERWLVFGGSWGSTLGLAYAERHPERVTEVVLVAVATTRRHEVDWITWPSGPTTDPGMTEATVAATDRFARRR